jgi:hypothetical protein
MPSRFWFLEGVLRRLRGEFSRKRSFDWFRTFVLGPVSRLGVPSAARELGLEPESYGSLVALFRSGAWTADPPGRGGTPGWAATAGGVRGQMLMTLRACRTPEGWRAVPVQRRAGSICRKLGIGPADLSLLSERPE